MRSSTVIAAFSTLALANAQSSSSTASAPVVTNNPIGAVATAQTPAKAGSNLKAVVNAGSAPDGKGIAFKVAVSGLPAEGGPFMYHIHEKAVPADGNCTGTGAHLDPYKRGETPICDATKKETCQTGDLSGKYGNITTQDFSANYIDPYTSLNPSDPSYFGKLSIVFHTSNKSRIACANFTVTSTGGNLPPPVGSISGYPVPTNGTLSLSPTATGTGGAVGNVPTGPTTISPSIPVATTNAATVHGVTTSASIFAVFIALLL